MRTIDRIYLSSIEIVRVLKLSLKNVYNDTMNDTMYSIDISTSKVLRKSTIDHLKLY